MKLKKYRNEINNRYPGQLEDSTIKLLYKKGIHLEDVFKRAREYKKQKDEASKNDTP